MGLLYLVAKVTAPCDGDVAVETDHTGGDHMGRPEMGRGPHPGASDPSSAWPMCLWVAVPGGHSLSHPAPSCLGKPAASCGSCYF